MQQGELIGEGKVAEVYAWGDGRVLKLYRAGQKASEARREAAILEVAEAAGLPAPRVFDVEQVDGRWGVVMSRVEGRPFAEAMLADPAGAGPYFTAMVGLQQQLHTAPGAALAPLKVRLVRKLEASGLDEPVIRRLRNRLTTLPDGDRLLHGDFHPYNILGTPEAATVVDWLDATCGPPEADVCRSWLLIRAGAPAFAETYLSAYLATGAVTRHAVLTWLPVLAGARLAENVPEEAEALIAMAETA